MKNGQRLKVALAFDDTLDSSDGVAQYVKTIGSWLSSSGYQVTYLVGETKLKSWSGGRIYSLSKNVKVRFNGNKLSIPLPANRRRIRKLLAENNFDVLHVMVPYSPFMAAMVIKQAPASTAVIGTFHIFPSGKLSVLGSRLLRLMLKKTLRRFQQIVSVSSAAAGFAKSAYRIDSEVLPNAVDLKKFRRPVSGDQKTKRIVFLGRLVERKGAEHLVNAFAKLAETVPNVELLIAGDGPLRGKLLRQVASLSVDENVHLLGYIDENKKPELLASADIACFPSLYGESFGIVLIEAMAAGAKIVLAGDNPGYRSVLGQQPELLIDPLQTDEFAKRLSTLLSAEQKISKLNAWQNQTVGQYDVNVVGEKLVSIYSGQIARLAKKSNNKAHG